MSKDEQPGESNTGVARLRFCEGSKHRFLETRALVDGAYVSQGLAHQIAAFADGVDRARVIAHRCAQRAERPGLEPPAQNHQDRRREGTKRRLH
jgi:hypothetical protein